MMRILFLNQVFYPDVAATAQHAHDLAKHLVERGHEVTAIASRSLYGREGELLPKREIVDGIEIHRVGRSVFGKANPFARAADYALFYIAAFFKAFTVRRPDVVVCLTTPPLIALVGWLMRVLRGSKFVYWVMDLYPDLPIACGFIRRRAISTRIWEALHRFCLRKADRTVVLGRCMKQRVLKKGFPADHVRIIHVWSDSEEVKPIARDENRYRREWNLGDSFIVMYAGNYGYGHDVLTMLEAAKLLRHRSDIKFVFAGGGVRKKEVDQFIADHKLINCQSQPYQPRERLGELLTAADLHIASQTDHMAGLFVPSKLFGILAAARPAVFIGSEQAENALVLMENDCGRVIACGDSQRLAQFIEELAQDREAARQMGQRGRQALIEKYSRLDGCRQWEQLLIECTADILPHPAGGLKSACRMPDRHEET